MSNLIFKRLIDAVSLMIWLAVLSYVLYDAQDALMNEYFGGFILILLSPLWVMILVFVLSFKLAWKGSKNHVLNGLKSHNRNLYNHLFVLGLAAISHVIISAGFITNCREVACTESTSNYLIMIPTTMIGFLLLLASMNEKYSLYKNFKIRIIVQDIAFVILGVSPLIFINASA